MRNLASFNPQGEGEQPVKPATKRKFGRLKCTMAHCGIGEILDLSAGGMRVRTRQRPASGQTIATEIITQFGPLPVKVSVRWVRRVRLFWFDCGLMFTELDDQAKKMISEFARIAADGEMVRTQVSEWIGQQKKAG
jgi:hypothetical protein